MSGIFRPTARLLMQPTKRMLSASAHTPGGTSWIKRKASQVPIEVWPLAGVVAFGSSFGIYSMAKALWGGRGRGEFRSHKHKQLYNE